MMSETDSHICEGGLRVGEPVIFGPHPRESIRPPAAKMARQFAPFADSRLDHRRVP